MVKDDLYGTWDLVKCEGWNSEGAMFFPYGEDPIGQLIYGSDGAMSVVLMDSRRTQLASEDIAKASSDEIAAAFRTFDAYCGRWQLDEATSRVEHSIAAGRIPNWVGKAHLRYCSIHNGQLTLTTEEFEMGGERWRVHVTWKRPDRAVTA